MLNVVLKQPVSKKKKMLHFTFMEKREAKRLSGKRHTVAFTIPLTAHSYIWLQAVSSWPQFCKPSIACYEGLKDDRASQFKETEATPDARCRQSTGGTGLKPPLGNLSGRWLRTGRLCFQLDFVFTWRGLARAGWSCPAPLPSRV